MSEVKIDYDEWLKTYQPILDPQNENQPKRFSEYEVMDYIKQNSFRGTIEFNAPFLWTVIVTDLGYGEIDLPAGYTPKMIEDMSDDDYADFRAQHCIEDTVWHIVNGYHVVNRDSYLISIVPFKGDFLEIKY